MPLILPNNFVNGQLADAVPVDQNYSLIEGYINTEVITRDGAVAMKAPLMLVGDPTQANQAANKDYVDAILPVGIMMPWPAPSAPSGNWHLCDGASLATSSFPDLFAVLGYRYGGSGSSFLLPKTTGRVMVGLDSTRTAFNTIGKSGGDFSVLVPQHLHAMAHTHVMPHTHEHPHTHSVTHDHGSFITSASEGAHLHSGRTLLGGTTTSGSYGVFVRSDSPGGAVVANLQSNLGADGTHTHTINVPSSTVTSAAASDATSGQPSAASTGASSATNTSNTGTANVELIPPFVIVNFIIRTK